MPHEDPVRDLMASSKCEVCGKSYETNEITILGRDQDMWVLLVSCEACHAKHMLAALIEEDVDHDSFKTFTELTETEEGLFKDIFITEDDMLDMHNYLKEFKGDFSRLTG